MITPKREEKPRKITMKRTTSVQQMQQQEHPAIKHQDDEEPFAEVPQALQPPVLQGNVISTELQSLNKKIKEQEEELLMMRGALEERQLRVMEHSVSFVLV
jgi:hypothetical protein